jgi:hypothetical protein
MPVGNTLETGAGQEIRVVQNQNHRNTTGNNASEGTVVMLLGNDDGSDILILTSANSVRPIHLLGLPSADCENLSKLHLQIPYALVSLKPTEPLIRLNNG